jgi:hypothetical protein
VLRWGGWARRDDGRRNFGEVFGQRGANGLARLDGVRAARTTNDVRRAGTGGAPVKFHGWRKGHGASRGSTTGVQGERRGVNSRARIAREREGELGEGERSGLGRIL